MIRSWIFDMDGVLVNSEPLHFEVDRRVLGEWDIFPEDSYLDRFVGMTNAAMWDIIRADYGLACSSRDLIGRQRELKLAIIGEREFHPIDGIPELMVSLKRKGMSVGVASSSPRWFIGAMLEELDLLKYIDAWESAEEVEMGKPAPHVYLRVAEMLGVAPERCTAVEDSRSGVEAAKAAGMACIGFRNPHSGDQDLSRADRIVMDIKEIVC